MLDFINDIDNEAFCIFRVTDVGNWDVLRSALILCLPQSLGRGAGPRGGREKAHRFCRQSITLLNCNYSGRPKRLAFS